MRFTVERLYPATNTRRPNSAAPPVPRQGSRPGRKLIRWRSQNRGCPSLSPGYPLVITQNISFSLVITQNISSSLVITQDGRPKPNNRGCPSHQPPLSALSDAGHADDHHIARGVDGLLGRRSPFWSNRVCTCRDLMV